MLKILLFAFLVVLGCTTYNKAVALEMVYMSQVSYQSIESINAWSCAYCHKYKAEKIKAFYSSKSNIQGFTAYLDDLKGIVIVFRGSTDIKNWMTNLNAITTPYLDPKCSGCNVHAGFSQAYNEIKDIVKSQVKELRSHYASAKIYITGHSLGGALAVLCALDMKQIYGVYQLTTMGQPRVGTSNFSSFVGSQIPNYNRIVNYADTVVHLPPSAFGFIHSGSQVWYDPRGMQDYRICVSEDPKCANSISTTNFSTNDHSLDNYIKLKVSYSWMDSIMMVIKQNHLKRDTPEYTAQQLSIYELNNINRIMSILKNQS